MRTPIRRKIKGAIGRLAASSRALEHRFRSKRVIVTFHRVSDALPEDRMTHSSSKFEEYCQFFRQHFRVVPLSEQVAGGSGANHLGGTLSITLDDGYLDNFEVAAPILRKLNLPAAFFVVTGFVGTRTVAPWDRELVRQPGWMDWDQLRSLASDGFEIGSHTDSHLDLGVADAATARAELEISRRKLEEQLGSPTRLFAYPFGARNNISQVSMDLVRETGFSCCLACYGGPNDLSTSPFDLTRISIAQGFETPDQFAFDMFFGRGTCVAEPMMPAAHRSGGHGLDVGDTIAPLE
jgi:peptidoglycan/xylan/chitin deacetylase (PgdA/CDA1 family)